MAVDQLVAAAQAERCSIPCPGSATDCNRPLGCYGIPTWFMQYVFLVCLGTNVS